MATDIEREIRRFGRRVRLGRFFGGASEALAASALVLAGGLLVLRVLGVAWGTDPRWLVLLPCAALIWGLRCARHTPFGPKDSAVHLDRRLGLDGLLLTALETDAGDYRARLFGRLERARAALPRIAPRPLALRMGVATLALAVVFLLPVPTQAAQTANPLGAEALAEFQAKLEAIEEQEALREEVREGVAERLEALQQGFEKEGTLDWADLDALERHMEHERQLQVGRLAQSLQDLQAFARGEDAQSQAGAAAAAERMQALLASAQEAGLLDGLPAGLRERLGVDSETSGGSLDLSGLDAETLKQLAAALSATAGEALEGLDAGELAEGLELADLAELLEGEGCRICEGEGEPGDKACPG